MTWLSTADCSRLVMLRQRRNGHRWMNSSRQTVSVPFNGVVVYYITEASSGGSRSGQGGQLPPPKLAACPPKHSVRPHLKLVLDSQCKRYAAAQSRVVEAAYQNYHYKALFKYIMKSPVLLHPCIYLSWNNPLQSLTNLCRWEFLVCFWTKKTHQCKNHISALIWFLPLTRAIAYTHWGLQHI